MMRCITSLLSHQKQAYNKLKRLKVGALYMEMGTGKTRTALELVSLRLNNNKVDKVIWLCPCSVKQTLYKDIIKHLGEFDNRIEIHGIESLSSSIKLNSYLLDLVEKERCYLIVDESNLVKNPEAKRTRNIIRLSQHCKYKLILNGTPISRTEADLFSQWYIIDWRILGYHSYWSFERNHLILDETGNIKETLNVDYLTSKISPYTYQVKKSECMDLPDKTYETVYYNMSREQNIHYSYVAEKLLSEIDEVQPHTIYRLFSALQAVIAGYTVTGLEDNLERVSYDKNNNRVEKLLDIVNPDRKTIIYCKYTDEIDNITSVLNKKYGDGSAVKFYGEMNLKQRNKSLDLFEKDSNFLVANKQCAGYGLNLQHASYIVYYNNDWDYATRIQSEDRVHRLGQEKNVHIVDICCRESLDERIVSSLYRKESLVNNFKKEIDEKKDSLGEIIEKYIYFDYNNKKKISKVEEEKIEVLEDLNE